MCADFSHEEEEETPVGQRLRHTIALASTVFLCAGTALLLELSSYLEHAYLLGKSGDIEVPNFEHSLILVVVSLLYFFPRRWQRGLYFLLLAINQLGSFIDVAYYRFFRDMPSFHLLPAWFQAGTTTTSIWESLRQSDLLVFLPVGLYLMLLVVDKLLLPQTERPILLAVAILLGALGFTTYSVHSVHSVRFVQLQRRFKNSSMEDLFGPVFYRFYDAYEYGRVQLGFEGGRALDPALVKEVVGESRRLSTADTPFQGIYEGRDLIFVQCESLEYFTVEAKYEGRPVMPFLYEARERVARFKLFDQTHLGRSADGQFIFLNSLHPPATRPLPFVYPTNDYYGLPYLFREKGYETYYLEPVSGSFWNSNIISRSYGFQHTYFTDDLPPEDRQQDVRGWGLTDSALFRYVKRFGEESTTPYFMYVVTVMCHHPYSESSNSPVDFPPPNKISMLRRYLRCAAVRDQSLRELMEKLALTERGRRTVLCLAGDHDANITTADMKNAGYPIHPEREAVPMMVGSVAQFLGLEEADPLPPLPRTFGGQMDLAPSLGHVFSLNMEESVFVGWNLFATQNRGPHHSRSGTWMDDTGEIRETEKESSSETIPQFEVSEMLLQSDKIKDFRTRQ